MGLPSDVLVGNDDGDVSRGILQELEERPGARPSLSAWATSGQRYQRILDREIPHP